MTMASHETTLGPAPLCTKCASIFTSEYDDVTCKKLRPHHSNKDSLQDSADSGCYICVRLRDEVNEEYLIRTFFVSINIIDTDVIFKDENLRRGDFEVIFEINTNLDTRHIFDFYCSPLEKAVHCNLQTSLQSGTRSHNIMRQARLWIDQCCKLHNHSVQIKPTSWLPTRLVYVDMDAMSTNPAKLCLRDDIPPETPYLTLSHRWGTEKFLTLTSTDLNSWRERIPIDKLSRVFQDAFAG